MNLENENHAIYKLDNEQIVHHIVGERYLKEIIEFEDDIDYEEKLKKKIEKVFTVVGFLIYFVLVYYLLIYLKPVFSLLSFIFQSIILLVVFGSIYDPIANFFNKIMLKTIFKNKIANVLEKRRLYFSDVKNQYELVKPLAYISATPVGEGEEGKYFKSYDEHQEGKHPIHTSYKIKSSFNYLRSELLSYFENKDYDKAIEICRKIYYQSRNNIAYVSNVECNDPYYIKLKEGLNI